MMSDGQPAVLLVDDEPERLTGLRILLEQRGATTDAIDPVELEADQLDGVHLVSVDQFLGQRWDEYLNSSAVPSSLAAKPADGVAVAAALTSQLRAGNQHVSVSLHTAEIDRLGAGLPRAQREPLLAASHDLDWVFRFDQSAGGALADRMTALADAVLSLPRQWQASTDDFGTSWLQLPNDRSWTGYAIQQVEDCRPPAHGLSANTSGRSFVRWLAQRILPYPSFLLDRQHAAVLLGIRAGSFAPAAGDPLDACRYEGPLSEFLGDRWWRAGLQDLMYEAETDETESPGDRAAALGMMLGRQFEPLAQRRPVTAYDSEGQALDGAVEHEEAVRLQPDGWPVFADDPWAARSDVSVDERLRALVVHSDRERLSQT